MRITLIYPEIRQEFPDFPGDYSDGIASILTVLENEGHEVSLFHITRLIDKKTFTDKLAEKEADIFAFSAMTNTFKYVQQYSEWAKSEFSTPVMCGGVHATLCPEEVITLPSIDYICIGEGEGSVVEFCRKWDEGKPVDDVKGFWAKTDDGIVKNPSQELTEDLDSLPVTKRAFFNYENLLSSKEKFAYFTASRGCPFDCAYCANTALKGIYSNRKKYVRFKSVGRIIQEIKNNLNQYPFIQYIFFQDDILPMKKPWFREFAEQYKKEINYPYYCNIYPGMVDEEVVALLKYSGCTTAAIGVESGNENIRARVLNRNVSGGKIEKAFQLFRKNNIRTRAYNMVGLPFEDRSAIFDTIEFNARIKPDFTGLSIFYPYPGTALYEECLKNGMITNARPDTYYEYSILKQDTLSDAETVFSLWYFNFTVKLVQILYSLPLPIAMRQKIISVMRVIFCHKLLPTRGLTWIFKMNYAFLRLIYVKFIMRFYSRQKKFFST